MPPKKSLPPLACPTYKFGVAHEFTVKGEWKISAILSQAQHQWLKAGAALVKMAEEEGNGWYIATEVKENDKGTFSVRLFKLSGSKEGRWLLERKLVAVSYTHLRAHET